MGLEVAAWGCVGGVVSTQPGSAPGNRPPPCTPPSPPNHIRPLPHTHPRQISHNYVSTSTCNIDVEQEQVWVHGDKGGSQLPVAPDTAYHRVFRAGRWTREDAMATAPRSPISLNRRLRRQVEVCVRVVGGGSAERKRGEGRTGWVPLARTRHIAAGKCATPMHTQSRLH